MKRRLPDFFYTPITLPRPAWPGKLWARLAPLLPAWGMGALGAALVLGGYYAGTLKTKREVELGFLTIEFKQAQLDKACNDSDHLNALLDGAKAIYRPDEYDSFRAAVGAYCYEKDHDPCKDPTLCF